MEATAARARPGAGLRTGRLLRAAWDRAGWWAAPALVLAAFAGALVARRHGLWYDELYTAEVAPLPLRDLARAVWTGEGTIPYLRDAPPSYNAPYYVVAHLWLALTGLAPDEVGLRSLSTVAAVAGVVALAHGVARLADRRTALVAGLLVGANPFVVEYAAEARGYGLALLASGLLVAAVARWLDGARLGLLGLGAAAAACGLAHWFALLVVGAAAVAVLVLRGRRGLSAAAVLTVGSFPALAVVGIAVANGVGGSGAEWIRGVGGAVPWLFARSWSGRQVPLLVASLLAVAAGAVVTIRARPRLGVVAACWAGLPLVAVTLAELGRPVYVDRYLLPAALGLGLLAAVAVQALPRRTGVLALVVLLAASVQATVATGRLGPKEDVRSAVALVAAGHRPGEPVVAAARWDALGLDHHARRDHPALVPDIVLAPAAPPPADVVWVVRRSAGGVKGDAEKLAGLDADLAARGLTPTAITRFRGRYTSTLVQRWTR